MARPTVAAASLATAAIFAGPAAEAAPPRVQAHQCAALTATLGPGKTWRTNFTGQRRSDFDTYEDYSASPCFPSERECKAWLYWAQTDWPHRNNFTPCRPVAR